jgi:hypothetical protein
MPQLVLYSLLAAASCCCPPLGFAQQVDTLVATAEERGLHLVNGETEDSDGWQDVASEQQLELRKVVQVTVKAGSPLAGRPLVASELRRDYDVALLGYVKAGHHTSGGVRTPSGNPGSITDSLHDGFLAELVPQDGDILVLEAGLLANLEGERFGAAFHKVHVVREPATNLFIGSFVVTVGRSGAWPSRRVGGSRWPRSAE